MSSDTLYEQCLPILKDDNLEDEDKTEKLEEFVREKTELTGKPLENAVLDILWRFRNAALPGSSSPTVRHTIVRRNSPAPWQASRSSTPLGQSPRSSSAVSPSPVPGSSGMQRPSLFRLRSANTTAAVAGSPFGSPRPSPAMSYANPRLTHSPSMSSYEYHETGPHGGATDFYPVGDFGSESNFDWLASDDGTSNISSTYGADYNGGPHDMMSTSDWILPQMAEMGPYDILRSILRDDRADEEIEEILEANGYDLGASIASLMGGEAAVESNAPPEKTLLIGKSMAPNSRPVTPATAQGKSSVVCRYWLASGTCLRADCRFSHELTNHVCKYWMEGKCLAGDSCLFSHDPALLVANLSVTDPSVTMSTSSDAAQLGYSTHDYSAFPSLSSMASSSNQDRPSSSVGGDSSLRNYFSATDRVAPPPGFSSRGALAPEFIPSRPQSRSRPPSRPSSSRHQSPAPRDTSGFLGDEETEAFPSLGSGVAASKGPKKHHGKRGHGHGHNKDKDSPTTGLTLADVVRKSPVPPQSPRRSLRSRGGQAGNGGSVGAAAQAIPSPERIPWLETGDNVNKAYMKARQDAVRHGAARNKFLQSAAQAWNRHDVRAAKALSLRGQSENDLMREAHREAARQLYEERNRHTNGKEEVFIDLHGLHPAEAVSYLSNALSNQRSRSALYPDPSPYLYAIIGTGHHSKNGRDKVGKAIRAYLNECRYAFREFHAPGDKGANGGILGIDASTGDLGSSVRTENEALSAGASSNVSDENNTTNSPALQHGKIRILKHEDALLS